ncbi:hypothetical protein EAF00_005612 [Botryotinia globosa]|nr:hypothetical protein EAF00_005612 [Botryotinia globosa]
MVEIFKSGFIKVFLYSVLVVSLCSISPWIELIRYSFFPPSSLLKLSTRSLPLTSSPEFPDTTETLLPSQIDLPLYNANESQDILLKNNKEYKEENNELKTLNKDNVAKIARLEAQVAKVAAKPRRNTAVAKQNSFDVRQQTEKLQEVMRSAIRAQIKWAPSCKTFGKRWSYTCVVPSADVFYTLFNMDAATELAAKKQWKQKKISIQDFK